ncbi:MAG: hypothetical protein IH991_07035 [Planctomycetes bacterium]|nr:hypothetical protein [Planctomycetota bacterium]
MIRSYRYCALALAILSVCVMNGCGDAEDEGPPLNKVSGKVTLDGKPVKKGNISFDNFEKGQGINVEIVNGSYEMQCPAGVFTVSITATEETGEPADETGQKPTREIIPEKFNDNSELKKTVKTGEQTIDFPLKS